MAGDWFGKLDLGVKYGIALGVLFFLVVCFAIIKLVLMKRKVNKARLKRLQDEESKNEEVQLNKPGEEEGDLFGVRALEKGFYGGVAQSRPSTPTASLYNQSQSQDTLVTSAHIPFGKAPQSSVLSTSTASQPASAISLEFGKQKNRAVDMNLAVPDSPAFPPDSPVHSPRAQSPLMRAAPRTEDGSPPGTPTLPKIAYQSPQYSPRVVVSSAEAERGYDIIQHQHSRSAEGWPLPTR